MVFLGELRAQIKKAMGSLFEQEKMAMNLKGGLGSTASQISSRAFRKSLHHQWDALAQLLGDAQTVSQDVQRLCGDKERLEKARFCALLYFVSASVKEMRDKTRLLSTGLPPLETPYDASYSRESRQRLERERPRFLRVLDAVGLIVWRITLVLNRVNELKYNIPRLGSFQERVSWFDTGKEALEEYKDATVAIHRSLIGLQCFWDNQQLMLNKILEEYKTSGTLTITQAEASQLFSRWKCYEGELYHSMHTIFELSGAVTVLPYPPVMWRRNDRKKCRKHRYSSTSTTGIMVRKALTWAVLPIVIWVALRRCPGCFVGTVDQR